MTRPALDSTPRAGRPLRWAALGALLLGALGGSGCMTTASPEISSMKDSIERDLGVADFDREFAVTLGRMSLGLGKFVLNRFDDTDDYRELWRGVKKVEVGVYTADARRSRRDPWDGDWRDEWEGDEPSFAEDDVDDDAIAFRLEGILRERGWTAAVTMRDGRERTWVYYRTDPRQERIRGVYVVALEGDELTLVRLSGRLDRTLQAAISLSRQYAAGEDPLL